ncbi:MAG TPA: DUF484 family protein [Gammaproteobacteria bacterium]|nr:DUF484 family protein [Gammaproteobacteria bacterium]
MNTGQDQNPAAEPIDETAVVKYLLTHPDFFAAHPDVLAEVNLPHETGPATSLIERQVAILRRQNHQHREQLQALIQIAQDNERLILRLQQLTLDLLDTEQLPDMIDLLRATLQGDFHADAAALHFTALPLQQLPGIHSDDFIQVFIHGAKDETPQELTRLFANEKPCCGKFNETVLGQMFPEEGTRITTAALIPLALKDLPGKGLLAIGSLDEHRFNAEMGTVYLQYMGELIGRKLAPHLSAPSP